MLLSLYTLFHLALTVILCLLLDINVFYMNYINFYFYFFFTNGQNGQFRMV